MRFQPEEMDIIKRAENALRRISEAMFQEKLTSKGGLPSLKNVPGRRELHRIADGLLEFAEDHMFNVDHACPFPIRRQFKG